MPRSRCEGIREVLYTASGPMKYFMKYFAHDASTNISTNISPIGFKKYFASTLRVPCTGAGALPRHHASHSTAGGIRLVALAKEGPFSSCAGTRGAARSPEAGLRPAAAPPPPPAGLGGLMKKTEVCKWRTRPIARSTLVAYLQREMAAWHLTAPQARQTPGHDKQKRRPADKLHARLLGS